MRNQAEAILVDKVYGVLPLVNPLRYIIRKFMIHTGANGRNTRYINLLHALMKGSHAFW